MVFTDPVCDFRDESIYTKLPSALRPDLFNAVSGRGSDIVKMPISDLLAKTQSGTIEIFYFFFAK